MAILKGGFALVCRNITSNHLDTNISKLSVKCVCDFRINSRGCEEEELIRKIHWILIPYSALIALVSGFFLYYRTQVKGQKLWFAATRNRGFIRPRPQDAFHIIAFVFNTVHIVHLALLLCDSFPNIMIAELSQDIPRLIGFGLAGLLPISIVYSIPNIESDTAAWIPNKHLLDVWGSALIFGPFMCGVPLAALTGYYADQNDIRNANKFFKIHYLVWTGWSAAYVSTVIFFWYKLISILNNHMEELKQRNENGDRESKWKLARVKRAVRNLNMIVITFVETNGSYTFVCFAYGMWHHNTTILMPIVNTLYLVMWNFAIPILLTIAQGVFIYNTIYPSPTGPESTNESRENSKSSPFSSLQKYFSKIRNEKNQSIILQENNDHFHELPIRDLGLSSNLTIESFKTEDDKKLIRPPESMYHGKQPSEEDIRVENTNFSRQKHGSFNVFKRHTKGSKSTSSTPISSKSQSNNTGTSSSGFATLSLSSSKNMSLQKSQNSNSAEDQGDSIEMDSTNFSQKESANERGSS